ncbi:MAG: SGNH/GDSL hydrolase family protein [Victivallales bacterium]|nr:SGNH/GDSL hydrolase family protein [Victivallales bacterium]
MNKIIASLMIVSAALSLHAASFDAFSRKAQNGARLTVAFLGGSLTWGANASDPLKTSYRALVGKALQEKYPKAHFTFVNAAIGGTGAQLGLFRLERDVLSHKPDLMFLDFTLNDNLYKISDATLSAYESIIRQTLEKGCLVVPVFLAAKTHVEEKDLNKMLRRTENRKMADHYNLPVADAVLLMNTLYHNGKLDLNTIWPPDSFDNTHPVDAGYKLYAQAVMEAYNHGVNNKMQTRIPAQWTSNTSYRNVARVKASELTPLPQGWEISKPETNAIAFDFVMSRWLDNIVRAANNRRVGRDKYEMHDKPVEALSFRMKGSSIMLFGEAKGTGGDFRVEINGKLLPRTFSGRRGNGVMPLVLNIVDNLDGKVEHRVQIIPEFLLDKAQELRIESICVAGSGEVYVKQ